MPLEEFVTKARLLVDDSGYQAAVRDEHLRDTLVFGLKSDKVRRDAIVKGNDLTFQQVYELAKVDESTRAQMKAITNNEGTTELHTVRSRKKPTFFQKSLNRTLKRRTHFPKVTRSHLRNHSSTSQRGVSDVEATMTSLQSVQQSLPNASIVASKNITLRCVLKEIIKGSMR